MICPILESWFRSCLKKPEEMVYGSQASLGRAGGGTVRWSWHRRRKRKCVCWTATVQHQRSCPLLRPARADYRVDAAASSKELCGGSRELRLRQVFACSSGV